MVAHYPYKSCTYAQSSTAHARRDAAVAEKEEERRKKKAQRRLVNRCRQLTIDSLSASAA